MADKRGVDVLVVADDLEVRSLVTSLVNKTLVDAGFNQPKLTIDLCPVEEAAPSETLLDAMKANNPQLFRQDVFITAVPREHMSKAGDVIVIEPPHEPGNDRPFSPGWIAAVRDVVTIGTVSEEHKALLREEHLNGTFNGPSLNEMKDALKNPQ